MTQSIESWCESSKKRQVPYREREKKREERERRRGEEREGGERETENEREREDRVNEIMGEGKKKGRDGKQEREEGLFSQQRQQQRATARSVIKSSRFPFIFKLAYMYVRARLYIHISTCMCLYMRCECESVWEHTTTVQRPCILAVYHGEKGEYGCEMVVCTPRGV